MRVALWLTASAGAALVGRALGHGDSDWALYRTITQGIPGTAMRGGLIARRDVWRLIAHLHDRRREAMHSTLPRPEAA